MVLDYNKNGIKQNIPYSKFILKTHNIASQRHY